MTKDPTNAQRQAAARKRLIEEGGRRLSVALPAEINALLTAETERTGEPPDQAPDQRRSTCTPFTTLTTSKTA